MADEQMDEHVPYGDKTLRLIEGVLDRGASRAVVLMRHSAREYAPDRHDLLNPLTEEGRGWAHDLGAALPKALTLRAYASPPHRCMETAELILAGHEQAGGEVTRHRPLEALGVFYALDQMKMWQAMRGAGGLVPFVSSWLEGRVPADAIMHAEVASRILIDVLAAKLDTPVASAQLDVCVSHDMTLYLMRTLLLGEPLEGPPVAYLDGIVLFEEAGDLKLKGLTGAEVTLPRDGD
ncbi:MAG: histidine phosphatase family protein [Pseudomonadales bacterium]|jgi:broad specificity phosphatase PhoE